ncbi:hypothetical protein TSOC_008368 [Tetrabaena socialis]|uniref:Uncharacterized protein n=1 Tax=Tetrabaena socialis TaxID=47790 RepID=A0A2J7ZYQ5_9CHLO|nr:hypothetical protein TSOC_008368 [Tetrabaena socialis]|eukprot:PNH05378.1 hypothetical protein TSOC_008368 [Tetrabaena socialis]
MQQGQQQMQQQMQQGQQQMQQQMQQVQQALQALQQIQQQPGQLVSVHAIAARAGNASKAANEPLEKVPRTTPGLGHGQVPANAPATAVELWQLNYQQAGDVLGAYGLLRTGNVDVRRQRIAAHLGVTGGVP